MQKHICIIIPCYNEANRLNVSEFESFLAEHHTVDLCFVNDGSLDNTLGLLEDFSRKIPERVSVIHSPQNLGKAEAVRQGMNGMAGTQQYVWFGFADADLATPLREIYRLAEIAQNEKMILVMGARLKRMGANIERKLFRHYMGRISATVISVLFNLDAYDTQCGAKIIDSDIVPAVFKQPFISKWLFDVEILLRIRKLRTDYSEIIKEVPLNTWIEQGDSRIRFSHLLRMPVQLWKIYSQYKSGRE